MKRVLSLCFFISWMSLCHANNYTPSKVDSLAKQDSAYGTVLFHYFQGDYQTALKEIALIDTSMFGQEEKTAHLYFKNVILMSHGDDIAVGDIDLDDEATVQAILIATQWAISNNEWSRAQQLFDSVDNNFSQQQSNQYHYLLGEIALSNQDNDEFSRALSAITKGSKAHALLVQHASVNRSTQSLVTIEQMDNASFPRIKEQALLARAIDALSNNAPQRAIDAVSQISLTSPLKNNVALVYGLALNQINHYQRAISIFDRLLNTKESSSLEFDARLAKAYAFEQLGDEQGAYQQLDSAIDDANTRLLLLPSLREGLIEQRECIVALLTNIAFNHCNLGAEELNESLLVLLTSEPFLQASTQYEDLNALELQYNQQLQTIVSFDFLLTHQITTINELLNDEKIASLELTIADTTAQRAAIVSSVDDAQTAHNGHFFLSDKYLALQQRIDETFSRMVFLKRAGQKNTASERRVTLLQKIVWWHSFSNFDKHLTQTREQITALNKQLTDNTHAYEMLQGYLTKIDTMQRQLEKVEGIKSNIDIEKAQLSALKQAVLNDIETRLRTFVDVQRADINEFIVNAKLAKVRIEDASFNRLITSDQGIGN